MRARALSVLPFALAATLAAGAYAPPAPGGPIGMDEAVNSRLAAEAGAPARAPYLDPTQWGELWNLLLLAGGGVCGFVVGRHWDQLWGRRREP